jgi:hypothetical protein
MPSTARTAETTAFENVRATPFTKIHGRPKLSDYEILKQEAATIASEVEDIIYAWSRDATTGDEYGLLGDIVGVDEYDHQTGIDSYVEETESDTYDGTINDATPTHTRKRKEESGSIYAHAGTFGKVSSRVSLQIFVTQLTNSSTLS